MGVERPEPEPVPPVRISTTGSLVVEAAGSSRLRAAGDLTVGEGAEVEAGLEGRNVTVRGRVTGPVTARTRLVLGATGSIVGDVRAPQLKVEDGATLDGNVVMTPAPEPAARPSASKPRSAVPALG